MHLSPDLPIGRPSFELTEDQIATVIDLLCRGVAAAHPRMTPGLIEVDISNLVKKDMRRIKRTLGLSNLEVWGEQELLDLDNINPGIEGRIDIVFRFLHQFGDEEAYLAVECKRVGDGQSTLNQRYVTQGVDRFVTGQYSAGHHHGMMLGYVLRLPSTKLVETISERMRTTYGSNAELVDLEPNADALSIHRNRLEQGSAGHVIQLTHVFVDTTKAAPKQ